MKMRRKIPEDQWLLGVFLTLMILAAVILWVIELSHQRAGRSRVPWPHETTSTPSDSN